MTTNDPGTQRHSAVRQWIASRRRILWWLCVATVVIALLVWGTWLGQRQGVFSAFLDKWHALQPVPVWDWLLALGLVLLAALALLALWKGPQWQVARIAGLDAKERFDRENEARKTIATILGGIALLTGGYFTWQNIKVAQEGQITDRFTKAIEQLGAVDDKGHKKLEVRLGGIYALARIADESERDHWPIMEILTAYVRENAKIKAPTKMSAKTRPEQQRPASDIQAILTVIGYLNLTYQPGERLRLDLSNTDLAEIELPGANLSGARLYRADLFGARLDGANLSYADLTGANLSPAILAGANLSNVDLSGATLAGADLTVANLSGASLYRADLSGALLFGATLAGADLRDADLSLSRMLDQAQVDTARGNSSTKLPKGLRAPESWKK